MKPGDPPAAGRTEAETGAKATAQGEAGSIDSGRGSLEEGARGLGSSRWWGRLLGAAKRVCCRRPGEDGARFEEALHTFASTLETAVNPAAVESALLRLARVLAPSSRVALVRPRDEFPGPDDDGLGVRAGRDGTDPEQHAWARRRDETADEVAIRCGGATFGRLRLISPAGGRSALREPVRRRLATAGRLAACALEAFSQRADWPTAGSDPAGSDPTGNRSTGLASQSRTPSGRSAPLVRDATFLNAVLPFALAQAQRHREPIALLCLGIDRLGAISDLLGVASAESLIRNVGETVASSLRSSDIVTRLDDDRLIVLLVRVRGADALRIAQMICRTVSQNCRAVSELPEATVSIGVAEFPGGAPNAFSLVDAADEALAEAQSRGRNQAVLATRRTAASPDLVPGRTAACTT